ncbi:hypothetical protein MOVI109754_17970 [Moritella viscosa]
MTIKNNLIVICDTAGYANVWIITFGKIHDEYLKSEYLQNSFNRLKLSK